MVAVLCAVPAGARSSEAAASGGSAQASTGDVVERAEELPPRPLVGTEGFHHADRGRRGELISAFLLSITPSCAGGESGGRDDDAALAFC